MVSDFKWAKLVVACLKQLRESKECRVPFVDHEVIPPLTGSPDGIFVWFICEYVVLKERFRAEALSAATERLRTMLVDAGLPVASVESLRSDVTSREEIEAGGGKFYFFR